MRLPFVTEAEKQGLGANVSVSCRRGDGDCDHGSFAVRSGRVSTEQQQQQLWKEKIVYILGNAGSS
eukprot:1773456-Rhodomonas_salina.1